MKPETWNAICNELQQAKLQIPSPEFTNNLRMFFRFMLEFLDESYGTTTTAEFMAKMPELSPQKLVLLLLFIRSIPGVLREFMHRGAQDIKAAFPATTGRKQSLTMAEKAKIVQKVGELVTKGASLGISRQRAAQAFGVSVATIRRAWRAAHYFQKH